MRGCAFRCGEDRIRPVSSARAKTNGAETSEELRGRVADGGFTASVCAWLIGHSVNLEKTTGKMKPFKEAF